MRCVRWTTIHDAHRETTRYFDVVNFARRVNVPGHYWQGYNDTTCPPTSTFAAFNVIEAPKEVVILPPQGHAASALQRTTVDAWLIRALTHTSPRH